MWQHLILRRVQEEAQARLVLWDWEGLGVGDLVGGERSFGFTLVFMVYGS